MRVLLSLDRLANDAKRLSVYREVGEVGLMFVGIIFAAYFSAEQPGDDELFQHTVSDQPADMEVESGQSATQNLEGHCLHQTQSRRGASETRRTTHNPCATC